MKINSSETKNGAKIIGLNVPGSKSVTIYFGFKVGSRSEDPSVSGISHFLEHMMFKGSKKRPTATAISRDFDKIGAQVNAATSKEYTYYHIKTIPEYFELALDIIGDMVTRPIISPQEVTKEAGTILQELHMGQDNPAIEIYTYMEEVLYGSATPMGRHIIGNKKTLASIKAKDINDYYNKYYVGQNTVCVVAGKVPPEFEKKVARYLNRFPKGDATTWPQATYSKGKVLVKNKTTDQATLGLVIPGHDIAHQDRFTLELIVTILSGMGMMSNRLFTEIREKRGWAYRVWGYSSNESDSGHYGIFGGIKKDKAEDTIKIIKKEVLNFHKTVTEEELDRAKGYLKGSLTLRYDDIEELATYTTLHYLLTGKVVTPESELKKYPIVTKDDIKRVSEEVFGIDRFYLALIGPYKNKEKFAKILAQK